LSPEHATQYEFAYEYHSDHFSIVINPFLNFYSGFITLQPIDSTISGLPVFKYSQFDFTHLKGIELSWHFHPHFAHWLHIENNFTYVRGTLDNGTNLALMPQPRMISTLRLTSKQRDKFGFSEIALQHTVCFAQQNVAFTEAASPRYQIFNVALNFSNPIKKSISVSLGVKNCMNVHYIDHLSRLKNIGMYSPGRNFYLSIKYLVGYKKSKSK
jgi:iron complex outermembrane receptor protein